MSINLSEHDQKALSLGQRLLEELGENFDLGEQYDEGPVGRDVVQSMTNQFYADSFEGFKVHFIADLHGSYLDTESVRATHPFSSYIYTKVFVAKKDFKRFMAAYVLDGHPGPIFKIETEKKRRS